MNGVETDLMPLLQRLNWSDAMADSWYAHPMEDHTTIVM
jgi:hypothetical protein